MSFTRRPRSPAAGGGGGGSGLHPAPRRTVEERGHALPRVVVMQFIWLFGPVCITSVIERCAFRE